MTANRRKDIYSKIVVIVGCLAVVCPKLLPILPPRAAQIVDLLGALAATFAAYLHTDPYSMGAGAAPLPPAPGIPLPAPAAPPPQVVEVVVPQPAPVVPVAPPPPPSHGGYP